MGRDKAILGAATPGKWTYREIIDVCEIRSQGRQTEPNARLIAMAPDLAAEVLRLREAITLIERCYYMEGKKAEWRAAHMNGIARDAQNGDDLDWARRLFPRDNIHL